MQQLSESPSECTADSIFLYLVISPIFASSSSLFQRLLEQTIQVNRKRKDILPHSCIHS